MQVEDTITHDNCSRAFLTTTPHAPYQRFREKILTLGYKFFQDKRAIKTTSYKLISPFLTSIRRTTKYPNLPHKQVGHASHSISLGGI